MQQLYKIGERRPCGECGKALVYGSAGWLHVRSPKEPHASAPVMADAPTVDVLQGRITELEALVEVQGNRIQVLLAENAKLAERVQR